MARLYRSRSAVTVKVPSLPLPDKTAAVLCRALPGSKEYLRQADKIESTGTTFCNWSVSQEDGMARYKAADFVQTETSADSFKRPEYDWPKIPKVLALIPHWRCERWLPRCLASLSSQTQALTNIVVIDDGSAELPLDIVQRFPAVTLLSATSRVGPYRLIQSVIDQTNYTAYLFQDADDWSSCDRLETLVETARNARAELVSCQEIRLLEESRMFQLVGYPLDVNAAIAQAPGHALIHPASLVTRDLVMRIGGFATGLQFGGDSEFLLRAHWAARIVNSPRYSYFRRKRAHSLTTATDTGLSSPARKAMISAMKQRAITRSQAAQQQQPLNLQPINTAPAIALTHIWGPQLQWN